MSSISPSTPLVLHPRESIQGRPDTTQNPCRACERLECDMPFEKSSALLDHSHFRPGNEYRRVTEGGAQITVRASHCRRGFRRWGRSSRGRLHSRTISCAWEYPRKGTFPQANPATHARDEKNNRGKKRDQRRRENDDRNAFYSSQVQTRRFGQTSHADGKCFQHSLGH